MECCICGVEAFFGLSILKYHKKICTACKASFIGLINFEHDSNVPINDTVGFTFFTPIEYIQYPTGKKVKKMINKRCKECFQFQESLVTEGGRCNLHGIDLSSERIIVRLYCADFDESSK